LETKLKYSLIFIAIFLLNSCFEKKQKNPDMPKLMVLDSLEKPNFATESDWKSSADRIVFRNAPTGFIVRGELCLLVGKAQRLESITTIHPSASDYKVDTYYDAITELTAQNCTNTKYAWLELNDSFHSKDLNIELKKLEIDAPTEPTVPFFVQMEVYAFNKAMNNDVHVEDYESPLSALDLLSKHRLQPIKSWVSASAPVDTGDFSFSKFVMNYATGPANIPEGSMANTYAENVKDAWFYVIDEPQPHQARSLQAKLDELEAKHPAVQKMVTAPSNFPVKGIDIYCPVLQHIKKRDDYPDTLWSYISCMSHGCGTNRSVLSDPNNFEHVDHDRSGEPDIMIDAPAMDLYALFLITKELSIQALLYFDSITQWSLINKGIDVFKDIYNFGGNGDGTLIYPDLKNKRAYPSLRLKILREASYMRDALELCPQKPDLSNFYRSPTEWSFPTNIRNIIYRCIEK